MERRVVRRVPVKKRQRTRWKPSTWGAIACVSSGMLWTLTLASMYANALSVLSHMHPFYSVFRLAFPSILPLGTWTFVLALIFMIVGLVALYLEYKRSLTVLGMI